MFQYSLTDKIESFISSTNIMEKENPEYETFDMKTCINHEVKELLVPESKKHYQCEQCDKVMSSRSHLHNVVLEKGELDERPQFQANEHDHKPYKCDECIKEYATGCELAKHRRVHAKEECEYCHFSFKNIFEHIRSVHNIEPDRPFECDVCKRTYRTKDNIVVHMKIHKTSRNYPCQLCSMSFLFATELRQHLRKHLTNHPFICDICAAGFKSHANLRSHRRSHNVETPLKCDACDGLFLTNTSLTLHKRTHTGKVLLPFARILTEDATNFIR